jgi:hypothetical protein
MAFVFTRKIIIKIGHEESMWDLVKNGVKP